MLTLSKAVLNKQKWKEIGDSEAQESLKGPAGNIEIGDGQIWEKLDGMEKLWCDRHKFFWEMRVWARG